MPLDYVTKGAVAKRLRSSVKSWHDKLCDNNKQHNLVLFWFEEQFFISQKNTHLIDICFTYQRSVNACEVLVCVYESEMLTERGRI